MSISAGRLPNAAFAGAILVGTFLAALFGFLLGVERIVPVAGVILGFFGITITLLLREKVWLLIPMMSGVTGSIGFLPAPIPLADIAKIYVFGMFLVFFALKIRTYKLRLHWLDIILWVNVLYLFTVFLRNPVGVNALGSELVGGKPYFIVFAAVLAWFVLSKVRLPANLAPWYPLLAAGLGIVLAGLSLIGWYFPSTVPYLHRIYSGVATQTYLVEEFGTGLTPERITPLVSIGMPIFSLLVGYFRPLSLVNPFNFLRMALFLIAVYALLAAGFRSYIAMATAYFLLGSMLRNGLQDIPKMAFGGVTALLAVILLQSSTGNLPYGMQRSLSFIPFVPWSHEVMNDAEDSADWRYQMWDEVWNEEGWIRNKWLGDGFGMTRRDLELNIQAEFGTVGNRDPDPTLHQKINGDYHNGPLSAIKFVGYAGLVFYTILIIARARYAWILQRDAKGTPYEIPTRLAAIGSIYYPFQFFFVFGAFNAEFHTLILSVAALRMFRNSVDDYLAEHKAPEMEPLNAAGVQGSLAIQSKNLPPARFARLG